MFIYYMVILKLSGITGLKFEYECLILYIEK
jgi:hypothetical protein